VPAQVPDSRGVFDLLDCSECKSKKQKKHVNLKTSITPEARRSLSLSALP